MALGSEAEGKTVSAEAITRKTSGQPQGEAIGREAASAVSSSGLSQLMSGVGVRSISAFNGLRRCLFATRAQLRIALVVVFVA